MATSVYFNNYGSSMEQNLLQELVAESIRINGIDVYYIPRTQVARDPIFNEDPFREYNNAYFVDVYLKSVDGFGGEGSFLQKFNLEIRDTVTFSISLRTFNDEIQAYEAIERPREGDLIFFPQTQRLFQISYVDKYTMMVPLGTLPFYDLKCELFEYSNERFNTGIPEIDAIQGDYAIDMNNESINTQDGLQLLLEDGYSLIQESWDVDNNTEFAQNDEIEAIADGFIDFSQINPFSENLP